jgi:CxxC motif-containing protein (DUF1111 family)
MQLNACLFRFLGMEHRKDLLSWSFLFRAVCAVILLPSRPVGLSAQQQIQVQSTFLKEHCGSLPANARSCVECHVAPVVGGSSQITVTRAGDRTTGRYVGIGDGGILHKKGESDERKSTPIQGLRVSLNLLGDGYVEVIPDEEFNRIATEQVEVSHGKIRGECNFVSPIESKIKPKAVGRFGWKAQHASILDASADALRNELGVPNRLLSKNTEKGSTQSLFQKDSDELDAIVEFVRNTEPIEPDLPRLLTEWSQAGSRLFDKIGCSICHIRTLTTAPAGTRMKGSGVIVSQRRGNKEIHPFSDYLLHDVGTGDGIVQNVRPEDYDESTANKFRTAPLWGVRFRSWLMHDGKSVTYHQAIMRHGNEASDVVQNYLRLTPIEKEQLRLFLDSL